MGCCVDLRGTAVRGGGEGAAHSCPDLVYTLHVPLQRPHEPCMITREETKRFSGLLKVAQLGSGRSRI